jgi:hypothetical protein
MAEMRPDLAELEIHRLFGFSGFLGCFGGRLWEAEDSQSQGDAMLTDGMPEQEIRTGAGRTRGSQAQVIILPAAASGCGLDGGL